MILNIFFSIKLIRQSRGGKKNFQGGQTIKNITEKHCFSKSRGTAAPRATVDPPLLETHLNATLIQLGNLYVTNYGYG
jgi:hypothetical protein